MAAVSFQNVSKQYVTAKGPFQALSSVSLDIEEGEFFGLLGPNGAGKTTLISILAGLNKPTSGRVTVRGHDVVSQASQARQLLGVVPQELVFDPFFNVREALRFQSGYFGVKHNDDWIDELLHSLGLSDKANHNMRQLSGGMKRRMLVAQALVHKPPVIVLDEPTAGLDPIAAAAFDELTQNLCRTLGLTVFLITHDLDTLHAICDRVAVLADQKVVAVGTIPELLASDHPWIQAYFNGPRGRAASAAVASQPVKGA